MRVHLFESGPQFILGCYREKQRHFERLPDHGSVSLCPLKGRGCTEPEPKLAVSHPRISIDRVYHSKGFSGGFMPAILIRSTLFLLLILSLAACATKGTIKGRVVDAETEHPIKGAAVAVRWVEDQPEANTSTSQTFDSAQDFPIKTAILVSRVILIKIL